MFTSDRSDRFRPLRSFTLGSFTPRRGRAAASVCLAWLAAGLAAAHAQPQSSSKPTHLSNLPGERPAGDLEMVATFRQQMPTGVTVADSGRTFVNFPRWHPGVEVTVAELVDGQPRAYPNEQIQDYRSLSDSERFVSVQSVVVGPAGRLWVLDTGRPQFQKSEHGGPKLVAVDLQSDRVVRTIVFPADVALPTTYLNDIRFDLRRGEQGMAYITDSSSDGPNAIIVVNLASGESWRKLHNHDSTRPTRNFLPIVEGRPLMNRPADSSSSYLKTGADGIAIGADGKRLYYSPLASRHLFSVSTDALADRSLSEQQTAESVRDHGDRGFASDGLESDADGRIYLTNYEDNAVLRWQPGGTYQTLIHHPAMLWPDTLSVAADGHLYLICNQLHRQPSYHGGKDLREKPYVLFRTPIDAKPVRLK